MAENLWSRNAEALAEAYVRDTGRVGFEVVTEALLAALPDSPQRVVDVGGGFGEQAIMLAQAGHSVVIVDIDPAMLTIAEQRLARHPPKIRSRVTLVRGDGQNAADLVGTEFDLVCCHNVLMYQDNAEPMLMELVRLARIGGLISIVSLNVEAYAMRSGLQGRWREAAALLQQGERALECATVTLAHSRERVTAILQEAGASTKLWHGVGVFTDHLLETIVVDDPALVYLVEWLAGTRDPYRQIARCFHLLAQRGSQHDRQQAGNLA